MEIRLAEHMKTHNFPPVLLTDLIMKSCRSETGSRCAMQKNSNSRLDVNTLLGNKEEEHNRSQTRRQVFQPPGKSQH